MRALLQTAAAAALLIMAGGAAMAADISLTPVDEVAPPAPPIWSWSGPSVGLQAGYAWSQSHVGYTPESDENGWNLDPKGAFVGANAGYDHQFSNGFVLGVAADINTGSITNSPTVFFDSGPPNPPGDYDGVMDLDWFGTARLKAGFAMDRWMPFVTGGLAYGGYTFTIVDSSNPQGLSGHSGNLAGWTVGGGVSYALNNWLILTAEYRFIDFGTDDFNTSDIVSGFGDGPFKADLKTHNAMLGLSAKF